jgi:hypothetical protein
MSDKYPDAFDGYYAWVQPGKDGWARDGSNYGEDYLNYFYRNMQEHHPDKIAVGAVWPGFDDSKAHGAATGTLLIAAARRLKTCCGCSANITDRRTRRRICWWKPGTIMKKAPTWNAA